MRRFLIFFIVSSVVFILFTSKESQAQPKKKVVKVKTEGGVIKPGDQHFDVGKQGKNKNDKVTRKGRRFTNRNEVKSGVKKQHKRDKQLEKRRKNPDKKYTASSNPKTKDAKEYNKLAKKQYREQKKSEKKSEKSRKDTMRFNKKQSRN
ncbi:MAG TPA: hypothetical protein DDX39_01960 [Bacteroidales bacterium]|nr:MAG: hypothetical protein A2W98_08580 [Bacteroidetes bacterium GWF2_33_38]OFY74104.1 MAG: hypothetical protein A2265_10205 [Bacteroidetes bacterium RIFOXYA12_FULL_33_9]OFY90280.1 MAG: hypothetical protein A2236_04410 [Bacteroidetes bacterium RIFOXYA2_FULL_33_7]HBF87378.1 hypothetical protein [Bacteroidales bacterium]